MPGGKIQLEAYGKQNDYFNLNPDITFFKIVYKRYTNFSMETIKQYNSDDINYKLGHLMNFNIGRDGDLLTNLYLEVYLNLDLNLNSSDNIVNNCILINLGHNIIDYIELNIGDFVIDKHTGSWLQIYNDLSDYNNIGFNGILDNNSDISSIIGVNYSKYQLLSGNGIHKPKLNDYNQDSGSNTFFYNNNNLTGRFIIPLQFWFCKNSGKALPLIALQYHEVNVKIKLNKMNSLQTSKKTNSTLSDSYHINNLGFNINTSSLSIDADNSNFTLWGDYIFLDKDERNFFALNNHEYLIEQIQFNDNEINFNNSLNSNYYNIELNFKYPVKELIWVFNRNNKLYETEFLTLNINENEDSEINILMNSNDRIGFENINYFTKYQIYKNHNGKGGVLNPNSIFVYSFSLDPEKENQPMGFCNFSGLNQLSLQLKNLKFNDISDEDNNIKINIYAINYNILRIINGMAGLLYSV